VKVAGAFSGQKVPEPGSRHVESVDHLHVKVLAEGSQPLRVQHQLFLLPLEKNKCTLWNYFDVII
jgi:hypothetical protein